MTTLRRLHGIHGETTDGPGGELHQGSLFVGCSRWILGLRLGHARVMSDW
jgi:hypothetical protein